MRPPTAPLAAYAPLFWASAMCALWAATSAGMFAFGPVGVLDGLSFAALLLFMAVIGLLIARSDPAQPVGWIFSLCPALVTTSVSGRLREQVDLEAVSQELLRVVTGTAQPAQVSLWLRLVTIPERQGGTL